MAYPGVMGVVLPTLTIIVFPMMAVMFRIAPYTSTRITIYPTTISIPPVRSSFVIL